MSGSVVRIEVGLIYELTTRSSFLFSVNAADEDGQTVRDERLDRSPSVDHERLRYGPHGHELIRVSADPGRFELRYGATVEVSRPPSPSSDLREVPFAELPSETLPFVNPSRFCESDRIVPMATRLFGGLPDGTRRVRAINDWVRDNLDYVPGSTSATTTATDVLVGRVGVCRDYAHVAITLCRAIGVPARYVSGYGVGVDPPDFHGFIDAYVGGRWLLFDPSGMSTPDGLVRIAVGRDAADAPFATMVGEATLLDKTVTVERS